jgi:hypothetical protein
MSYFKTKHGALKHSKAVNDFSNTTQSHQYLIQNKSTMDQPKFFIYKLVVLKSN